MLHVVLHLTRIANAILVVSGPRDVAAMEDTQLTALSDDIADVPLQLLGCAAWDAKPLEREGDQMRPKSFVPASTVAERAGKILQSHMMGAATNSGDAGATKPGLCIPTYIEETPLVDLSDDDEDMLRACVALEKKTTQSSAGEREDGHRGVSSGSRAREEDPRGHTVWSGSAQLSPEAVPGEKKRTRAEQDVPACSTPPAAQRICVRAAAQAPHDAASLCAAEQCVVAGQRAMYLARAAFDQARRAALAANGLRNRVLGTLPQLRNVPHGNIEDLPADPPYWVGEALRAEHPAEYVFHTVLSSEQRAALLELPQTCREHLLLVCPFLEQCWRSPQGFTDLFVTAHYCLQTYRDAVPPRATSAGP